MKNCRLAVVVAPLKSSLGGVKENSWEYISLVEPLRRCGIDVVGFDYFAEIRRVGKAKMNANLFELVRRSEPDLVLFTLHSDELDANCVADITRRFTTIGYFYDDPWRMDYSCYWSRYMTFVTTSDVNGLWRHRERGCDNVIYSPFGSDHYKIGLDGPSKLYDVSFVGGYHPVRAWYFRWLASAGIHVDVWGPGWPKGGVGQVAMMEIFRRSRINLNLSNCIEWDIRYILSSLRSARAIRGFCGGLREYVLSRSPKNREMIKFRQFEICASGSFQISYMAEGLERFYVLGDEIAVFASPEDLVEKVRYFLRHDHEREGIARNGLNRTLKDHSMTGRCRGLLSAAGFVSCFEGAASSQCSVGRENIHKTQCDE